MSRYTTAHPAIPSIILYRNDYQLFTNAGQFHIFDTVVYKTSHFHYNCESGGIGSGESEAKNSKIRLENNQQNMYEVTFECSFTTNTAENVIVYSQIYKNGVAVAGSRTYTNCSGAAQSAVNIANVSIHYILYLEGGDYIQVKTITNSANAIQSYTQSPRLMINFIPIRGWDNSKAGRVEYKGRVMR